MPTDSTEIHCVGVFIRNEGKGLKHSYIPVRPGTTGIPDKIEFLIKVKHFLVNRAVKSLPLPSHQCNVHPVPITLGPLFQVWFYSFLNPPLSSSCDFHELFGITPAIHSV